MLSFVFHCSDGDLCSVVGKVARKYLNKQDTYKFLGSDALSSTEGAGQHFCKATLGYLRKVKRSGEFSEDWKKANLPLTFKNGKGEDPGIYRPASLTLIPLQEQVQGRVAKTIKGLEHLM